MSVIDKSNLIGRKVQFENPKQFGVIIAVQHRVGVATVLIDEEYRKATDVGELTDGLVEVEVSQLNFVTDGKN